MQETGIAKGRIMEITLEPCNHMTELFALLAGYVMNRFKLFPEQTAAAVSRLVTLVFLPALMLYTFMGECTVENLRDAHCSGDV